MNTTMKDRIDLYKHLATVVAKHGQAAAKAKLGVSQPPAEALAEELAGDLEAMGPAFIKLGQLMAGRSDLLPSVYHDALTRLHDDVNPIDFSEVDATVFKDFGRSVVELFAYFDKKPLATASLGQVHRAVRHDGRVVAVKVMRPGVQEQMQRDLDAIEDVAATLEKRTQFGKRNRLTQMVASLRTSLNRELDYRKEGAALQRFRRELQEYEKIEVPCYHQDLSSEHVLTMDYLDGFKTDDPRLDNIPNERRRALAHEVFSAYLYQVLELGCYHADPHPGNLLILPGPRLGLIDLGMVGHLTEELRHQLTVMLLHLADGKAGKVAEAALQISEMQSDSDTVGFRHAVVETVNAYRELPLAELKAGQVVMDICSVANQHGLRVPAQLTMLAKTLLHLDEVGKVLDPDFSPNEAIRQNASRIIESSLSDFASLPEMVERAHQAKRLVTDLPQQLNQLLTDLAEQNYTVRIDAIDEQRWIESLQKIANRLTAGLILAALILGAAIMTHISTPEFTLFGYPGIAMIAFLLATGGALVLVSRILWGDRLKPNPRS